MKKKRKLFSVILVAVIVTALFASYIFIGKDEPANAQFSAVKVNKGDIQVSVSGSGTITPSDKETVRAQDAGRIESVLYNEGDQVKKGDNLVLFQANDLSEQIYQEQLNLKKKELDLLDLQSQAKQLDKDLLIKAKDDGNIISLNVKKGDEVKPNMLIASIKDSNTVTITVPFNSAQLKKLAVGQKAEVFVLDSFSELEGVVSKIDTLGRPVADGSILYDVTVEVKGKISSAQSAQVTVITANGEERSLEYGNFVPADKTDIFAQTSGTVKEIYVNEQDWVEEDQKILLLESDTNIQLSIEKLKLDIEKSKISLDAYFEEQIPSDPVTATIDGEITNLYVKNNDYVNAGTNIAELANYQNLELIIEVDELDIPKLKIGQKAEVTIEALPNQFFTGEVTELAKEGIVKNGVSTFNVTIKIDNNGEIRAGMTAQAKILVEEKKDVLLVDIEAVQEKQGQSYVLISKDNNGSTDINNTELKKVDVGIHNENYFEIVSGLNEGDSVLLPSINKQAGNFGPFGGSDRQRPEDFGGN